MSIDLNGLIQPRGMVSIRCCARELDEDFFSDGRGIGAVGEVVFD